MSQGTSRNFRRGSTPEFQCEQKEFSRETCRLNKLRMADPEHRQSLLKWEFWNLKTTRLLAPEILLTAPCIPCDLEGGGLILASHMPGTPAKAACRKKTTQKKHTEKERISRVSSGDAWQVGRFIAAISSQGRGGSVEKRIVPQLGR